MRGTHRQRPAGLRHILGASAVVSALALAALPAVAGASGAVTAGSQGEGPAATCFWGRPEASVGPLEEANETFPTKGLAPDTNTDYYVSVFQLPAGATVTLHGQFPHARFMSLTAYKNISGQNGIPGNSLVDENIVPDAGSVNPFGKGASRNAVNRSFTITISGEVQPVSPAPNTLYAGQEGHTGETQTVEVIERIYRADRGLEANAGVPLPAPTYDPTAGSPVSGEGEVCSDLSVASGPEALNESKFGVTPTQYKALRSGLPGTKAPATHPAVNPIRWERFFNQGYLVAPFYRGTAYEPLIAGLSTEATSGLYATPANAYATGYASRLFGPNHEGHNILVLHAKMPTHVTTYNGNAVSEDGSTQVRYWSLCNYTGISKAALLEANSACLFDEEVPTNIQRDYTIVISLPQDRPKNATPGCGVAWMNWGTVGDGEGRPDLDLLIVRNQLSNPSFAQSIEKVKHPGEEEAVMGEYYPHGTYETQLEFEASENCRQLNPGTTTCNGIYSGSGTEVTVPAGAICTLEGGTKVTGNVQVQKGGTLIDPGALIAGNVQATNAASIQIGGGGSIGGNLRVQGLTGAPAGSDNSLCNTTVTGNVEVENSSSHSPVDIGNLGVCSGEPPLTIGGNLLVHNNAANATVGGNTVKGNLQVQNNTAKVSITGNTAGGNIQVNNNTVGVGGTLTGNNAGGSCELGSDSPAIDGSGGGNTAGAGHSNTCNRNA